MKLLVTGGAGFIGSNFIRYWLENHPQDEIVNLDVLTYAGNLQNLTAVENNPNYTFVKGDILDAEVVDPLVRDCDIVVHFAAESHVDRSILGPMAFVKTNFEGTAVLLEAARKYDKRFHHISTDEVFGSLEYGEDRKFNEETAYDPKSPYSASKAASDHLVRAYGHTFGLKYTISNCTNNFGAYHFPEKFIPLAITNLMEGKPIPIYGDGQQIRDWLYVDDHSRAVDLIIHKGEIGHTYGIGGLTEEITNLEVARKILALMGKDESHLEYVQDRLGHDVRYAVDWSKSQKMLGYEPAFDFDENLKMTVEWYKNNEEWWRAVKDGSYEEYYAKNYKKLDA